MSSSELYNHALATLRRFPGHTIVRHVKPNGMTCYRIRDNAVNPIANFSDSVFNEMRDNNLLIKINEREWQLKQ